jgi:hypothetical protein
MKTLLFLISIGLSTICLGQNRFDKEFKKADSAFDYRNSKIYVSDRMGIATTMPVGYFTVGNGCNKAKVSVTKDLVVTIHIDGFQVTDTIWIQAGKRKVGIPAYKFLDYFK